MAIRSFISRRGMQAVIPSTFNRKHPIAHDRELYKQRNRTERSFGSLKKHHHLSIHFDRNDSFFLSFIFLAASLFWL